MSTDPRDERLREIETRLEAARADVSRLTRQVSALIDVERCLDSDNKDLFDLLQSAEAVLKTAREKLCEEFCHLGGHCKECSEIGIVLARLTREEDDGG